MKKKLIKKPIERISEHGKLINQSGETRDTAGFGHIIIPVDLDREVYIRRVYDSGKCMIVSTFDDPIRNVVIPKHLIQELVFPLNPSDRGSLISWINIPRINQLLITGILIEEDETNPYKENTHSKTYSYKDYIVSDNISTENNSRTITVKDEQSEVGKLTFQAIGRDKLSRITINADGTINLSVDDLLSLLIENRLNIQLGSEENKITTLSIVTDDKFNYTDNFGNILEVNQLGFSIKNNNESFIKLIIDLLKMYIKTKTIDGKPLDPKSLTEATTLITRFNTLFN